MKKLTNARSAGGPMTTKGMVRTTIELFSGDKGRLQEIARRLGYVQTRGIEKGRGSLSALLQAIARGEIKLTQ